MGVIRAACVIVAAMTAGASAAPDVVTPAEAIAAAVVARMGAAADVTVEALDTDVAAEAGLVAEPGATARVGKRAQFVLSAKGARRGVAVATVRVRAPFPRAARAIARDEEIDASAVNFTRNDVPAIPIKPLLDESDFDGVRARRAIAIGETLTSALLRVSPVVKSGDEVEVTVRIRAVRVTGTGIASGSGQVGDTIRIMQPHSSRLLKGRITGPGAVEIVE
jgi:flagella basal body P-ring formation protein FlgA